MFDLPQQFTERMKRELGEDFESFLSVYQRPAERAIRVNTLKISVGDFLKISPFELTPVGWEPSGFYAQEESLGKTILHAAGAYYVQEPSAMSVVPEADIRPGQRVLDLCSAPGGKGTQAAQYMRGEGLLVLNEINFQRAKILCRNVERMGIKNAVVTCAPPEILARSLEGYFDRILIDAPCSGEGMFKKEPEAIPEWSPYRVEMCASRQKKILESAKNMLCGGGLLVYSTCTFSREEDELCIENFLSQNPCFSLVKQRKLYPHQVRGEGHYFAVLKKEEGDRADLPLIKTGISKQASAAFEEWAAPAGVTADNLYEHQSKLYCLPKDTPVINAQVLRLGVTAGEVQKGRFIPSHSLAASLTPDRARFLEVDGQTALFFLRGLTFRTSMPDGWYVASYKNLPLGWCKAAGGIAKNHLPKGVRI